MITLTQQERERFVLWLRQEADTIENTSEQMKTMKVPEAMIVRFKIKTAAYRLVANDVHCVE